MRRIDSHQHFWSPVRGDYGWLAPDMTTLYRDFMPSDLRPLLDRAGIDTSIVVQAAPTEAETAYLLELAAATPWIEGVVGWIDLGAQRDDESIARLQSRGLIGIRPMLQDIEDPDWILMPAWDASLRSIAARGLVFDALIRPVHIDRIAQLADRYPALQIVIDHGAKPAIGSSDPSSWMASIASVARRPNVACKISGLLTEAPSGADAEMLRPWVDHLIDVFGPDRLLWGSDWPVLTTAASYERWYELSDELFRSCSAEERTALFGGTAARIYGLPI